jgi:hypothetical protein
MRAAGLLLAAAAALACRGGGEQERAALERHGEARPKEFDWSRPEAALAMGAGDAAARLGDLEFEATVTWTVGRGPGSRTVRAGERHRVRQGAGGAFEVESTIDPGNGPAAENGLRVVHVDGRTFAKGRWAPFRERPTDRGENARRQRDQSFRLAGDLAGLYGPALVLREAGEATALGRKARRFTVGLDRARAPEPPPAPPGRSDDADTRARVELLEGRVPLQAEGEVLLDAATGAPLATRLRGAFGAAADPLLRVEVELDARVVALGARVAAIRAPSGAKPDERKPAGPARALEAAGLRERGRPVGAGEREAPEDEPPPER